MRRFTGTLLLAAFVAAPLLALDKGAEDKSADRAKQFNELKMSLAKARTDAIAAYQKAQTNDEKQKVVNTYNKSVGDRIVKMLKLVEAKPGDDLSFEILEWTVMATGGQNPKVYDLLVEHQIKNPKMASLVSKLAAGPPDGATVLFQKVLDKSTDKKVQGLACYGLAQLASGKADRGDKKAGEEAEKLLERVAKDFAETRLNDQTLGDLAKKSLSLMIGHKAPNVVSEDLEGKKVQLTDYKGKVVVLDIWATWCPPCRAMIPHEREMVKKLKDKPFALISISGDEKKETLKKFLEKEQMPWTHWWNGQRGGIITDWNVRVYPTIYVLDRKGVIRYKHIRGKELEEAVEKLLAEREKVSR